MFWYFLVVAVPHSIFFCIFLFHRFQVQRIKDFLGGSLLALGIELFGEVFVNGFNAGRAEHRVHGSGVGQDSFDVGGIHHIGDLHGLRRDNPIVEVGRVGSCLRREVIVEIGLFFHALLGNFCEVFSPDLARLLVILDAILEDAHKHSLIQRRPGVDGVVVDVFSALVFAVEEHWLVGIALIAARPNVVDVELFLDGGVLFEQLLEVIRVSWVVLHVNVVLDPADDDVPIAADDENLAKLPEVQGDFVRRRHRRARLTFAGWAAADFGDAFQGGWVVWVGGRILACLFVVLSGGAVAAVAIVAAIAALATGDRWCFLVRMPHDKF